MTKIGKANLADGSFLPVESQLADPPPVLFNAVAIVCFPMKPLLYWLMKNAAINFMRDAFGHWKTIAVDKGG